MARLRGGVQYGPAEADWYPELSPPPDLKNVEEVAAILRGVSWTHPTQEVRRAADDLHTDITGHYGEIRQDPETGLATTRVEPDFDDLLRWLQAAKALLRAIHEPPAEPGSRTDVAGEG